MHPREGRPGALLTVPMLLLLLVVVVVSTSGELNEAWPFFFMGLGVKTSVVDAT